MLDTLKSVPLQLLPQQMSFTSLKLFLLTMEFQKCSFLIMDHDVHHKISAHFPKSMVLSIVQVAQTTLNLMAKLSEL